jgi:hypothetical protein
MKVQSYKQFKEFIGGTPRNGYSLYRGIGGQYPLLPSIAYSGETNPVILEKRVNQIQQTFKKRFSELYPDLNLTDYQLVFLARHYGSLSPFMDFSFDDTIAIQFGMAETNNAPVHLYVMNVNGLKIHGQDYGIPDSVGIKIFRPYPVWSPTRFLTGQQTQLIQCARLVSQSLNTLHIPFNKTYADRITRYEIYPEDFNRFREEIMEEGTRLDADLLIDREDCLFELARKINEEFSTF